MNSSTAVKAIHSRQARIIAAAFFATLPLLIIFNTAWAAAPTPKQLEAYGQYVGKTYWVVESENKTSTFLSSPSPTAPSFRPAPKESFEIKEIVGGTAQSPAPYYRVTFNSGKEGFIPVGAFIEEIEGSFASVDPDREAKAKLAKSTEAEKKRAEWIRMQKWPEHVKEAALKRQPVLGMSENEATAVLGKPKSMVTLKSANILVGRQMQWVYENGPVLTFTNGLVTRIQPREAAANP